MKSPLSQERWQKTALLVLILAPVVLFPASRVSAEKDTESELPRRETQAALTTEKLAGEAREREIVETGGRITYEDLLRDPDNVELNFRFAKTQIRGGDVIGAAATLERILLVNANLARVRLLYAVVLFRLDNITEAEREFKALSQFDLPADLRAEIKNYLRAIKRRRSRTHFALRESVGYQIDTNRNAVPSSKKRSFGNVLADIAPSDGRKDDTSILNITGFDIVQDLGFRAGHQLFGKFDYFMGEQTEVDNLDLHSYQGELGATFKSEIVNVTPSFFLINTGLSRETFMRSQGGNLRLDRDFFKRLNLFAQGRLARQDFSGIQESPVAFERSGDQLDGTVGGSLTLTNSMNLSAHYTLVDKDGKEEYNAYNGNIVGLGHAWLLGKGQFLINSLDLERDEYEAPDLAINSEHRGDKILRLRTTYGLPLKKLVIGKLFPWPLNDLTLTFTYEYYRAYSSITNYTYRNNKFQFLLTKTWEF